MYIITTALKKLKTLDKRIHGIQGGTSASKTISIIQILIDKCQRDKTPKLTSITAESLPHLKRGAMRDFKDIMEEHGYWDPKRWNASNFVYTFETGTNLEFFSLDSPRKVRGPRRKRLFINEANSIPYETFDQLEVRTEEEIWLDWNPVVPFWWHEDGDNWKAVSNRDDADELILTYLDNEGLPETVRKSIEQRRNNEAWWRVYGLGQLGVAEGRIYKNWKLIDEIPHEARLERYGLDFGYTNDPAAIVAVYWYNGGYILDEKLYRKGMFNNDIAGILKNLPFALTIADSAEPKSIDEISLNGVSIQPARKGADSVVNGIAHVQNQKISVTKRSVNLIKEYRNYLWDTDRDGRAINKPIDYMDHLMDATRYALESLNPQVQRERKQPSRPRLTYGSRRR